MNDFIKKKIIKDNKFIVDHNTSLKKILQKFNIQSNKIIFILKNKKLIGSITDGDIRRKIIKNISVDEKLNKFFNKKPLYLKINESTQQNKILYAEKNQIEFIPVVSKDHRYLGFVKTKDLIIKKNPIKKHFDIVIMAGGFGKRLFPITKKIPKPLIKIGRKPVIDHLIESFKENNINKIYLILHYKADLIKKHINKNFPNLSKKIEFIIEKKPLDTAGGLKLINLHKSSNSFLLINSDILTNINFDDFFKFYEKTNADLAACTSKNEITVPFGVLKINNKRIKNIKEKPIFNFWINSGIYFLNKNIINLIKKNEKISAVDLMKRSIKKHKRVVCYPIYENWIDIGNQSDLIKAQNMN